MASLVIGWRRRGDARAKIYCGPPTFTSGRGTSAAAVRLTWTQVRAFIGRMRVVEWNYDEVGVPSAWPVARHQ